MYLLDAHTELCRDDLSERRQRTLSLWCGTGHDLDMPGLVDRDHRSFEGPETRDLRVDGQSDPQVAVIFHSPPLIEPKHIVSDELERPG